AYDAALLTVDGERLRIVAHHGALPIRGSLDEQTIPISMGSVSGRAVIERCPVQVADVAADPTQFPEGAERYRLGGLRTRLSVPLLRESGAIWALHLRRRESRPFSDKQIALLETFADQAVIAIENVRLFKELEARNRDLTAALAQQTATAEILRVISSSPTE